MILKLPKNPTQAAGYKQLMAGVQTLCSCNSPFGSVEKQAEVHKLFEQFINKLNKLEKK